VRHLSELVVVVFGHVFVLACEVFAVAPTYASDEQSAEYPDGDRCDSAA
jgi:hypothetical protein